MTALPRGTEDEIPGQDAAHERIRGLLTEVTAALLAEQPGLIAFRDHRPERDRSSGGSWRGLQTLCHVSALLAADGDPDRAPGRSARLLEAVERCAHAHGLHRRSVEEAHGVLDASWVGADGGLLEVVLGVRVGVRAISAPFLPGSLEPPMSTSPVSALSPLTPPPRLVR
jgi:hypothetical protein